jgi:hypothetical protein
MKFLSVLGFVLRAQSQQLFQFKNALSLLGRVLFLSLMLLYAVGFGYGLQNAERLGLNTAQILTFVNMAIIVLTFTKSYFPAYQTTSQPIASFYPISRINKALLGFLLDMLSVFPLAILTLYVIMFGIAFSVLTPAQIALSLLMFLTALVLDRSLRLVIEYAMPFRWLYGACVLVCGAALVGHSALPFALQVSPMILLLILFVCACVVQALLSWQSVLPSTEQTASVSSSRISVARGTTETGYALKAFFGSKHITMLFGMATLLKIGMMFFLYKVKAADIAETSATMHLNIIWVYTAPVAWFTYVLNNSFGMNWQLWQSVQQHGVRRRAALGLYIRYAVLPLCMDAVLSSAVLWYRGLLTVNIVVFWLWCMLTFLALGLATSILSPIKVEKLTSSVFMSLRQVSPTVGIVGVIVLLLALLLLTTLHYLLGGFIALVAVASMVYLFINYNTLKYRTYNGIHQ